MFKLARRHQPDLPDAQLRTAWQLCSTLLDYPTRELLDHLGAVEEAVATLPEELADPLARFVAHLRTRELRALQEEYVATFDHTRRCALYLTYFAYGDTRRRGVALVQFKQAYRRAGVEFEADELPDHVCAVLQFGACVDREGAWRLLLDHRAGLEMLRLALTDEGSPWADVAVALCATFPVLQGEEADAVRRLIEQGPPAEEVGLEPFLIDPQLPVGAPSGSTAQGAEAGR
jgi:nitrate reductase delta subunit